MIIGGLGLTLNILTIAFLSFSLSLMLMSGFLACLNQYLPVFDAKSRSKLLWCVVLTPWLAGFISVVVLVFPELFSWTNSLLPNALHWHHIESFPILSWHGASLLLFCGVAFLLLLNKLIKALNVAENLSQLNHFVDSKALPNGCLVVESEHINAFTCGFAPPQAYITSGLMQQLSNEENAVVQQHELAHVFSAHPLKKYIFSLFSAFFSNRLINILNNAKSLAYEQLADQVVLSQKADVSLVSKTIIKVTRLKRAIGTTQYTPVTHCAFTGNALEQRVRYLLDDHKGRAFPYFGVMLSAFLLASISTFSVDYLHHLFEQLFSH